MINLTYYEVGDCYDAEGRGPYTVIARFKQETDAYTFAKGRGNYGKEARVAKVQLFVAETLLQHMLVEKENMKQAALKKLTKAEIELLGLN